MPENPKDDQNQPFYIDLLDWQIRQSRESVGPILEGMEKVQDTCVTATRIAINTVIGWQEDANIDTTFLQNVYDYVKTSAPFYTALQRDLTRAAMNAGIESATVLRDSLVGAAPPANT